MEGLIYYFSGTGNSLLVARKIAERMDGVDVKPVTELTRGERDEAPIADELADTRMIGFVFPVYFDRIPDMVRKAVETAVFAKDVYVFAVATSGGLAGNALYEFDGLLKSRGMRLNYGRNIDLADNSITIKTSDKKTAERFARIDGAADEIALAAVGRIDGKEEYHHSGFYSLAGGLSKFALVHFYQFEDRRVDFKRCSHCRLCADICPSGNITIQGQEVQIGKNCEKCYACINWCPKRAIRFGRVDPSKKRQYRCPGIHAGELLQQSGRNRK